MTSELRAAIAEMAQTCDTAQHVTELVGGPVRLQVVTTEPTLSGALAEALSPGLVASERSKDQARAVDSETVQVAVEPGLIARLRRLVGPELLVLSDGTRVATTGTGPAAGLVCWHRESPHVTRVLLSDVGATGQRTAIRAVRAVAERGLLAAGWTPLQAACACLPERGAVLLLGPRGAGKTTTLLCLLAASPPAKVVANSTVFVIDNGPRFRARALPISVAIRPATLQAFPLLRAVLATVLQAAPSEHAEARALSADKRLLVSPAVVARCFGTTVVPEVDVSAIVAVDHCEGAAPTWRPAPAGAARTLLESAYPESWLPDTSYETTRLAATAELRSEHERRLDRLALGVPCAVLRPGADPAGELQRCLDRLLV